MAILATFGESYVRENTGGRFRLVSHESRPSLTLIPPMDSDKRPSTFRFIDAVQRLTPNFTKAEWTKLYEKVGARLHLGQLKKTFIVLSDEERSQGRFEGGPRVSGSNSVPAPSHILTRGRGGGRGGGGVPGVRKRVAESDAAQPTPSKASRGRN